MDSSCPALLKWSQSINSSDTYRELALILPFQGSTYLENGPNYIYLKITTFICCVLTVVQLLSHIQLFVTPWTAPCQAPLSSIISQSLLRFMSTESVMLSNHLILCCPLSSSPQSFPASGSFPVSWLFTSGGQIIGASASATVLPMNIQGGFPLGLTALMTLQSEGLSRVFSSTTIQKHPFFGA